MKFTISSKTNGIAQQLYDSSVSDQMKVLCNPILKLEVNKAGSLSFTILPTHPAYSTMKRMLTYVTVELDNEVIFRGRVLDIEDSMYMERNVTCEGDLAYLNDSMQPPDGTYEFKENEDVTTDNSVQRSGLPSNLRPQMPKETFTASRVATGEMKTVKRTPTEQFTQYIQMHNSQMEPEKFFNVGEVTVKGRNTNNEWGSTSFRSTLSAIENDLIAYYGGYLQTREVNGAVYIDWLKEPGTTASQVLRFGENLLDMQKKNKGDEIYSRLVPVGKDGLLLEEVRESSTTGYNQHDTVTAVPFIQNDTTTLLYGRIYKTINYSNVTSQSKLRSLAQNYMEEDCRADPVTFTLKAIDLRILGTAPSAIRVGQKVRIIAGPQGIDVTLNVVSIEYDIQNPENNTYEIGDPRGRLTQKLENESAAAAETASAAAATAGHAAGSAANLEQAVNRHAANIIDIADKMYTLQADEIKVSARVVSIETDLLDIKTRALEITANQVRLTADYAIIGNVVMGGNGDYEVSITGDTHVVGALEVGGNFHCEHIEGGLYYNDGMMSSGLDIGPAILSFGTASSSGGTITIPYTCINGAEGSITFNMASTAYYTHAVEAAWNDGGKTAYMVDEPYLSTYGDILRTLNPGQKRVIKAYYVSSDGDTGSIPVAQEGRPIVFPIAARELNMMKKTATSVGTFYPDTGKDGFSEVTVSGAVHDKGGLTAYVREGTWNDKVDTVSKSIGPGEKVVVIARYVNSDGTVDQAPSNTDSRAVRYGIEGRALNLQNAGTKISNGTYTPGTGYDGIGSITFDTSFAWNSGGDTAYVGAVTRIAASSVPSGVTPTKLDRYDSVYRINPYYKDQDNKGHPTGNYYYLKTPANASSNLQTKTFNANGTYKPDSGYDGFSQVTVALPGTVSIDSSGKWEENQPSGTRLTSVETAQANHNSGWVKITVNASAGGTGNTKTYYFKCS